MSRGRPSVSGTSPPVPARGVVFRSHGQSPDNVLWRSLSNTPWEQ